MVLSAIASLAPAKTLDVRVWERIGNAEMREAIEKVVGADVVDCGLVELTRHSPGRSERRKVLDCIRDAQQRQLSFKYGTVRFPIDSVVHEVYAQSAAGEAWMFAYDEMALQQVFQLWINHCKVVTVDDETLIISGKDCVERVP